MNLAINVMSIALDVVYVITALAGARASQTVGEETALELLILVRKDRWIIFLFI